jgi:hypothetical protein
MKEKVKGWAHAHKPYLKDRKFMFSVASALIFLVLSIVLNFYAAQYAMLRASNPVTDIILSNIRVYDVDWLFIYGAFAFWAFFAAICIVYPNKIPFLLKSVSLFIIIRAIFVILTHIAPFPTRLYIPPGGIMSDFTFGSDLFFSGHTGLPFLMALVFWNNKIMRIIFICISIVFGVVVLLAHLHYSIDVLGAFFITYSIFHIAEKIFPKDQEFFFKNAPRNY